MMNQGTVSAARRMQRILWLALPLLVAALMPASASAADLTFVGQFGGVIGSGPGQFVNPDDLAVDSAGNVYVADTSNNRIQKFTADGQFLTQFGTLGTGAGQLTNPNAVAVDSAGNVYVADRSNHRVMQFNSVGGFVRGWGWSVSDTTLAFQVCTTLCEIGIPVNSSTSNGGLNAPHAIAVDASGDVYVSEFFGDQRVQRFAPTPTPSVVSFVAGWGAPGSAPGQFARPVGLALDSTPNVFVADRDNSRVQKFTTTGGFLAIIGSLGSGAGQLNQVEDVAVDPAGNVFVADGNNRRIEKFTAGGVFLASYGLYQPGAGDFVPAAIAFSPQGDLYVIDSQAGHNFRILRLREPTAQQQPPPPPGGGLTGPVLGLPGPVLGKRVNVGVVKGNVFVSPPPGAARASASVPGLKGRQFTPLRGVRQIPVGSLLDTRKGTVDLTSATNATGAAQSGKFSAGVFQVLQSSSAAARGLTELRLKGSSFRKCRTAGHGKTATAARHSRRTVRRLSGNANGRFRTRGQYSAATVRGTIWETTDRCDGTLVKVSRGSVAVRDFRRKKTITVRAGKRYLAQAPK